MPFEKTLTRAEIFFGKLGRSSRFADFSTAVITLAATLLPRIQRLAATGESRVSRLGPRVIELFDGPVLRREGDSCRWTRKQSWNDFLLSMDLG